MIMNFAPVRGIFFDPRSLKAHTRHVITVTSTGTYPPIQIKTVALFVTTREVWISLQETGNNID